VTGRINRVSLLTSAHACSQACSHGQVHKYQGVRSICEVCEANFFLFLEINKYIGRGAYMASRMGRCEDRDFSLTLLTAVVTGPSKGGMAEGRARRIL